jgi:hypothetical protein
MAPSPITATPPSARPASTTLSPHALFAKAAPVVEGKSTSSSHKRKKELRNKKKEPVAKKKRSYPKRTLAAISSGAVSSPRMVTQPSQEASRARLSAQTSHLDSRRVTLSPQQQDSNLAPSSDSSDSGDDEPESRLTFLRDFRTKQLQKKTFLKSFSPLLTSPFTNLYVNITMMNGRYPNHQVSLL